MKRGIEICAKEFNDAGGYQGRKVDIAILDDQVKPEIAVANITRFLEQDKVVAIIGPVSACIMVWPGSTLWKRSQLCARREDFPFAANSVAQLR